MKKPVFTVWHWSSVKVLSHWNRYTLCFDPVPVKDKAGPVQTSTDASLFHCSAVWCYETLSAWSETWDCSLWSEADFECTGNKMSGNFRNKTNYYFFYVLKKSFSTSQFPFWAHSVSSVDLLPQLKGGIIKTKIRHTHTLNVLSFPSLSWIAIK